MNRFGQWQWVDFVHGIIRMAGGGGVRNQCVAVGCSTVALGRVVAGEQNCLRVDERKGFKTHSSVDPVPAVWLHADSNSASQRWSCNKLEMLSGCAVGSRILMHA